MDQLRFHPKDLLIAGLVFLLAFFIYAECFQNELMFDDQFFLRQDYRLFYQEPVDILTVTASQHYSPLFYWINIRLFENFGHNAFALHLFNFILLCFETLLLFIVFAVVGGDRLAALLGALLFLFHPVNLEQVTWITNNVGLVTSIFACLSFIEFYRHLALRGGYHRLLSIIFFALALLTSEFALLFLVWLGLYMHILRTEHVRTIVKELAGFGITAAAFLVVWFAVGGPSSGLQDTLINGPAANPVAYVAAVAQLSFWYLRNLIYPADLVFMHNVFSGDGRLIVWLPVFCLAMGTLLWYALKGKNNIYKFCALWMAAGFLPFLAITVTHTKLGFVIEPHWFHLSSWGFFLAAGIFLSHLRPKIKPALFLGLVAAAMVYNVSFLRQYQPVWKTQESYARYWRTVSPKNEIPLIAIIGDAIARKQYAQAWREAAALERIPGYPAFMTDYIKGFIHFEQGNLGEAQVYAEASVNNNPSYTASLALLGSIYWRQNRAADARARFEQALRLDPNRLDARMHLVMIDYAAGHYVQALGLLEEILKHQPHADAYWLLSRILIAQQQEREAMAVLKEGLSLGFSNGKFEAEIMRLESRLTPAQ